MYKSLKLASRKSKIFLSLSLYIFSFEKWNISKLSLFNDFSRICNGSCSFFSVFFFTGRYNLKASDLGAYYSQFSAGDFALKAMKTLVLKLIKCSKWIIVVFFIVQQFLYHSFGYKLVLIRNLKGANIYIVSYVLWL